MLSQVVKAAYGVPKSDGYHIGQLTVTGLYPCPYSTYLTYYHLDDKVFDSSSVLRMKNGKWQEAEMLEDLHTAGFSTTFTGKEQMEVNVGRVPVKGKPDGIIKVDGEEYLLELKAMSLKQFTNFKTSGLEYFPGYMTQVQCYMASEELSSRVKGAWVYAKHKDSCLPFDIYVERDTSFSKPIIEAVEDIVLGKVEVKKPSYPSKLCQYCHHHQYCWGKDYVTGSNVKVLSSSEAVDKWKEGKFLKDYGESLIEEAREGEGGLISLLGNESQIMVGDLKVKRINSKRTNISEDKFISVFGVDRLPEVLEEKVVSQVRVTQLDE